MQLRDRIGRRLKLQDLHVLMAVIQAGSMSRAAKQLNMTQPNVSRSIADLEGIIGARLLDRNRHGIQPTAYGRALLDGGTAAFDELRQAITNIEFLADPTAGEVRIGYIPLSARFVSAVIDRLSRSYPRIVFHAVADETDALHRRLTARSVDLLIARRWQSFPDEEFDFAHLYDETYAVVASTQNPWARRRRIALPDLVNEPWALPPPQGSVLGSVAMAAFRASGLEYPRPTVTTLPYELRMDLVATGRFLTILSTSILRFSAKRTELQVLPVKLSGAHVPNGIVTLKHRTLGPVANLFIEQARNVAALRSRPQS
jgi:DNA-binding transcriptional LysR family regulator